MTDRLLLLRHAQTTGPKPQADLTIEGHCAAARLVTQVMDLGMDAVCSGRCLRAVNTAARSAARLNQPLHLTTDLARKAAIPNLLA